MYNQLTQIHAPPHSQRWRNQGSKVTWHQDNIHKRPLTICWWLFLIKLEESATVGTVVRERQPRRTGILFKAARSACWFDRKWKISQRCLTNTHKEVN